MSSKEIEDATERIRGHLTNFLTTVEDQMREPRLTEVVEKGDSLSAENIGQTPERCVEDALIFPTLRVLGFEVTPRPYYPYGKTEERPDFRVDNLAETVIGENKSVNNFSEAKSDIEEYLDSRRYEYGLVTDGLRWALYELKTGANGQAELYEVIEEQSIAPAVRRLARERGLVDYTEELHSDNTVESTLGRFYQTFNHYGVRRTLGGLTEFYDLYLETLTGAGDYESLSENLVDSIESPSDAGESDTLAFAALFVDRLALLQLLLDRGILEGVALHREWTEHNTGLNRFRGSFYSQHLQPLIYDALGTPQHERDESLSDAWRGLPYLDGGLFKPLLPEERAYDIPDETMRVVLTRFIEGEERTVVNEATQGSLLETYTEEYESREVAGRIARHYSTIVDAYRAEVDFVESEISRTLRSFESGDGDE
jgi:hypothetical protein